MARLASLRKVASATFIFIKLCRNDEMKQPKYTTPH